MSEDKFKNDLMDRARSEGYLGQRFEDSLAAGVPDLFIGSPFIGMWIEAKWKVWPKKHDTPLLTLGDKGLRGTQLNWLKQAWKRPNLSGCLVGSPDGWVIVPAPAIMRVLIEGGAGNIVHRPRPGIPSMTELQDLLRVECWNG